MSRLEETCRTYFESHKEEWDKIFEKMVYEDIERYIAKMQGIEMGKHTRRAKDGGLRKPNIQLDPEAKKRFLKNRVSAALGAAVEKTITDVVYKEVTKP